jgi:hemoglobin
MNPRPAPAGPDYVADALALGVDEAMIDRLVQHFYAQVRLDPMLAPVFEARVGDWEAHLRRMSAFWSSVMLRTGRYHGQPMPMHAPLPVDASHFDRWLALFESSARRVCDAGADLFIERAHRIAQSLELGIATSRGLLLRTDERLPPLAAETTQRSSP